MRVSVTSRTAVYGPVRTVVWEGWSRKTPPYPDQWRKAAGRYRQCVSAGGAPTPPLQRRDGRRALSRNPRNRLTPVRRATRPTTGHKKPDPCASVVGFLSRVHMGPV